MGICGMWWVAEFLFKNEGSLKLKFEQYRPKCVIVSLYCIWYLQEIIAEVMKKMISTTKNRTEFIPSVALSHICLSMAWDVLGSCADFDLVCN